MFSSSSFRVEPRHPPASCAARIADLRIWVPRATESLDRFSWTRRVDGQTQVLFCSTGPSLGQAPELHPRRDPVPCLLFHPNQGTCIRTAADWYVAFVSTMKKSWGGQKTCGRE
jgi:hypothetical protein